MSAKWRRVKRWDAEHLTGPLTPVRWVLAALSSITLAVILLTFVAAYGALASVPIGLIALIPTWTVVILTAIVAAAIGAAALVVPARMTVPPTRPGWRFSLSVLLGIAGATAGVAVWFVTAWPAMRYDEVYATGFRLFPDFVAAYDNTTLRRLPGVEMTELEFYSWWPLRIVLVLFVVNMFVATVRRIEFTFKNIGVLTVHTGIIVIALGSVYYQALKKEGDALLRAGMPNAAGEPGVGVPARGFYDNTHVALWVAQRTSPTGNLLWESRPLRGVPRYNDYALDARPAFADDARIVGPAEHLWSHDYRPLSVSVPQATGVDPILGVPRIDPDINLRIVGYAEYAQPVESLLVLDPDAAADLPDEARAPVRVVDLLSRLPDENGVVADPDAPAFQFTLRPDSPAARISENDSIAVEYTLDMPAARMADLAVQIPAGTAHAVVVEIPAAAREDGTIPRVVLPARPGIRHEIGDTGWRVGVKEIHATPPFPIITEGFLNAQSSVAVVEITPPDGQAYDRWVYHRFPEINQDLLPGTQADGRPNRRDADPAIRVGYVDASKLQVYFNERTTAEGETKIDALIRAPGAAARVVRDLDVNETIQDVVELIDFRVSGVYDHAMPFEHPAPVPEADRDNQLVGTHSQSMLAVEISADSPFTSTGRWSTVVWVPFLQYLGIDANMQRTVAIPGGRSLTLQFGRIFHPFPGFNVQLVDFEMIAYDHRGAPRDYQSIVRVSPTPGMPGPDFESYQHVTKLNAPLTAPFLWSDERSMLANLALRLTSGLDPNQYKLSQAGWDQQGWTQTQEMTDRGELPRPFARYTILQVGNNPGIHIIAFGGILMGIGIPWAFYVKPWLVRRERERLAAQAASQPADAPRRSADQAREQTAHENPEETATAVGQQ